MSFQKIACCFVGFCFLLLWVGSLSAGNNSLYERLRKKNIFRTVDGDTVVTITVCPRDFLQVPTDVSFYIKIEGTGEKYYCPALQIEWSFGDITGRKEDCRPYQKGESIEYTYHTPPHRFRSIKPHMLYVRLLRGKKAFFTQAIPINGGSPTNAIADASH